ncbi:hypothetical protein [Polyangium aurulentum]|uniref:hypothetical protein n=1 Tax=Polyangium aurulentum TaxID=2567896 RepID=UPI0010ADF88A|nr:hypothetical protein [Polyangium aurulentum]UQA55823.1 hypothetical protein E8A73_031405 [Polyangium aurulentum]
MKGRAYELLHSMNEQDGPPSARDAFTRARIILQARVIPDSITPELDDIEVEHRLERALMRIRTGG